MDASLGVAEQQDAIRWVMGRDRVLVRAAAVALGAAALEHLSTHFREQKEFLKSTKIELAYAALGEAKNTWEAKLGSVQVDRVERRTRRKRMAMLGTALRG